MVWLSIIVAGLLSCLVGVLWYSPVMFGNTWLKLSGISQKEVKRNKKKGMAKMMISSVLLSILTAFVLSFLIGDFFTSSQSLLIGFFMWLGFVFPILFGSVIYEKKPFKLFLINAGHYLVAIEISALVLSSL